MNVEWASRPDSGPALCATRAFEADCSTYDRLVVKLAAPTLSALRVTAQTDLGPLSETFPPSDGSEREYGLDLKGAKTIAGVTLELEAGADGPGMGWLRWVGLQNTEMLKHYLARWDFSNMQWDKHLVDDETPLEFKPRYGIFLSQEKLDSLRAEHAAAVAANGRSVYNDRAETAAKMEFEKGIHEFSDSGGNDDPHARTRDADQAPLPGGPELAIAGLVLKDRDTLRAAARHALSRAMSEHWDEGFMSTLPGSPWEDRCFERSYASADIAQILDLAGEIFTDTGRKYLMRRLAEEGVGKINFVTWRHEYIFRCNQLAYFNKGRMSAYLVLEREWPRVKPYTDLAMNDTLDNLGIVIEPDGGSLEGPSYLMPTIRENYNVLEYYALAREVPLQTLLPECLKRTGDFAAVVASTTKDDVIPICDAGASISAGALSLMSNIAPESYWTTMLQKALQREGKPVLAPPGPPLPAFLSLPSTGHLASCRQLDGQSVKVFVMGNKNGAEHTHEDKGSFVLEFAGQTFALDPGIVDYDKPIHIQYKHCQRHNMLVPTGLKDRPRPPNPLRADVRPSGKGDNARFEARMDVSPGWEPYYKRWVRSWESASPERLVIRDEYELAQGDGVEFYWQTLLPCEVKGTTVTITGERGSVTLTASEGCTIRIDKLPLAEEGEQTRIAIGKAGVSGALEVGVQLAANGK